MFLRLKRLYEEGRLTADGLTAAVQRGWLTAAQMQEILGEEGTA